MNARGCILQISWLDATTLDEKKLKLLRFAAFSTLVLWQLSLIFNYIVHFLSKDAFAWLGVKNIVYTADFVRYYVAGQMARSADHLRIYDIPAHLPYVNAIVSPLVVTQESSLNFPPTSFLIMSAVSLLPFIPAFLFWIIASASFAFATLTFFLRRRAHSRIDCAMFCLAVANSVPAAICIRIGQWCFWLVGLFSWFFYFAEANRPVIAGILLGLLTIKPQFSLPLLAMTAARKQWRTCLSAAITIALINAAAAMLIGFQNVLNYPKFVSELEKTLGLGVFGETHASLRGLISNVFAEPTGFTISTSVYWIFLVLFTIMCAREKSRDAQITRLYWSMAMLVGVIAAPAMHPYDLVLLSVPAALTLTTLSPRLALKIKSLPQRIWHLVFLAYPCITWIKGCLPGNLNYIYALINLGLFVCAFLTVQELKRGPNSETV